ncbi:helix-turn-helix transcriptional regulator [Methyloceanibacter sp.]|uniref:helix-turn-helix transcriptional regulator n=1 Tax=Methyloceanibacter sp. TaxID=1965321 RepID=UPI003C731105
MVNLKVVMQMTSLSRSEIARREESGKFPKRVHLSAHPRGRKAWVEREVHDWIDRHISARSV